MKKQLHIRRQHSRGSSANHFGGPDTYVAVTIAPNGVIVPNVLRHKVLRLRGIEILYFGEGYAKHTGPTSMLGKAIAGAKKFCES